MFHAAADRVTEERVVGPGRRELFPTAGIVLNALACEIALKAMIAFDQNIVDTKTLRALMPFNQGHDLEHLYGLLAPHRPRPILLHLKANYPTQQDFIVAGIEGDDELNEKLAEASRPMTFQEHLARSSNAFEQFRYGYEHDGLMGHETFLKIFAGALLHELGERSLGD
jgi:hypothetical protein